MGRNRTQTEWRRVDGRDVRVLVVRPQEKTPPRTTLDRPLLLLHGLAGGADVWTRTLDCMGAQSLMQPIFAPDLPGCGGSPGPRAAMDVNALAGWSARLLDALDVPCAHVAAQSLGCQVALALARRHPDRVGGMALVGPTTGRHLESGWRYALGMLTSFHEPLSYKWLALRLARQMGLRRYVATVAQLLRDDPLAEIQAVRAPCLILRGALDPIIPETVARELAQRLPRGAFLPVARAAHIVPWRQPSVFCRLILAFLAGASPVSSNLYPPANR